MITHLKLKNFTAFTELAIDFTPGINIIIGENGTGKTQLLKAILALSGPWAHGESTEERLAEKLCRLYLPLSEKVGGLRRSGSGRRSMLSAKFNTGREITATFGSSDTEVSIKSAGSIAPAEALFIPTKEVLSLARGVTSGQANEETIKLIFDDGYIDLAKLLFKRIDGDLSKKIQDNPRLSSIAPRIANLIGGRYTLKQGQICFQAGSYKESSGISVEDEETAGQVFKTSTIKFFPANSSLISSAMTAEGFRKIGMLQRLLSNGSLNPGITGPLLWDEPESNLNPKLIRNLVQALLELARNGQQVILATHDYVLLKWFDLLMDKGKGDHLVFHRLYRIEGEESVQHESQSDYSIVGRSAISNTFAELYDEDVKRALGGLMQTYRAEETADLLFNFPDNLSWSELDRQGVKLPVQMKFVDLVIEREKDILLVEIKDPSHSRCTDQERKRYFKRLSDNSVLTQELTPKARDSYLYMHLMERDRKPFKYVVLLGLDAFDPERQKAIMFGFKDRLLADIREESFEAWKRKHIADCVVLSVESWNQHFPDWPLRRQQPEAALGVEGLVQ